MTFFQQATPARSRKQQKKKEKRHTAFPLGRWDVGNPWTSAWGRQEGGGGGLFILVTSSAARLRREKSRKAVGGKTQLLKNKESLQTWQPTRQRWMRLESSLGDIQCRKRTDKEQLTDCVRNSRNTKKKCGGENGRDEKVSQCLISLQDASVPQTSERSQSAGLRRLGASTCQLRRHPSAPHWEMPCDRSPPVMRTFPQRGRRLFLGSDQSLHGRHLPPSWA